MSRNLRLYLTPRVTSFDIPQFAGRKSLGRAPAEFRRRPQGKEPDMAKGQKKSNKEARKPKKEAAKPPVSVSALKSFPTAGGR